MANLKSERHHWWPECLSDFWKDEAGRVHWLLPDGTVRHLPPKNIGAIVGGHHIKMGIHPDEAALLNDVVQVYARDFLFYRAEEPNITEAYRQRSHLVCRSPGDPIDQIIADVANITGG